MKARCYSIWVQVVATIEVALVTWENFDILYN
jgi:hypothetical protein